MKPLCPVGEEDCRYLTEIEALRLEVTTLSALVRTDSLTGLFNHRHFREVLEAEVDRSRRSGQPTALIMVDLDHFKRVNDEWGHETGNRVLQLAAELMHASVRKSDVICRYGGEEFAVVLPATPLDEALAVAERIRTMIESTPLCVEERGELWVTASLGVNVYHPDHASSADYFIHATDEYLYLAKGGGRNRVCHPPLEPAKTATQVSPDEKAALMGLL